MFSNESNGQNSFGSESKETLETLTDKIAALEKQVAELQSKQMSKQSPDILRYSLFPAPVNPNIIASSSSSAILSSSQPILKPNSELSESQISLQKQLIQACYNADLPKVKALVQQGADPTIPDESGQRALGAAMWGLALEVVNYLTARDHYHKSDINEILLHNQLKHSLVLPAYLPKNTFKYLAQLYASGEVAWLFNENIVKDPRFIILPEVRPNLDKYRFVTRVSCVIQSIYTEQFSYYKNGGSFSKRSLGVNDDGMSSPHFAPIPSNIINIQCYRELLERMSKKIKDLGGNIDKKYRLQDPPICTEYFYPSMPSRN